MSQDSTSQPFLFGIYGGSIAGTPTGLAAGEPDDLSRVAHAFTQLCGVAGHLYLRAYLHFATDPQYLAPQDKYTEHFAELLSPQRSLDLVLCFHDRAGDVDAWLAFILETLGRFGPHLSRLQITEEPNLRFGTGAIDGDYPNVIAALTRGVIFAKSQIRRRDLAASVGFSAAPSFGPVAPDFWSSLDTAAQGTTFVRDLDYVGLDCFPDVFRRTAAPGSPGDLASSVTFLLDRFRNHDLAQIALPRTTPIVVTENGWPTGPDRGEEQQATALDTVVRAVYGHRQQFNVAGYQWFSLRDADSANPDLFHQFGLLRSDYSPKPAFARFGQLIAELGTSSGPRS